MPLPTTCPFLAVDIIIELPDHEKSRPGAPALVLIERRYPPLGWALPGGFVDVGEPVWHAAEREAEEETSLQVELLEQLFTYSDPARDTRRHTISTLFLARAHGTPTAADDAGKIGVFTQADLPPLAFDHGQMIQDYFTWKQTGRRPPPKH